MNMKKIMAGVVAGTMAVGAMAVAANAAAVTSTMKDFYDDGSGNYQVWIRGDGAVDGEFADVDFTEIASFDITLSWADSSNPDVWVGGGIVLQSDAASWNDLGQWANDDGSGDPRTWANVESGKPITVTLPEAFAADSTYVIITIQNWGAEVNIDALKLYDASGATLYEFSDPKTYETAGGEEEPDETTAGNGDTEGETDPDKTTPNSGIEGVAVVAGLAIVAAGAVVVAKKRK